MKAVFEFLTELKENNNRDWFNAHRQAYEQAREQMLFLTDILIQEVRRFDTDIPVLNARDCLFRIFRDVRFAKDKSPYKTNMGSFIAPGGRKSELGGYYIHLEPGASFVGGGVWCPSPDVLRAIRQEIYESPESFKEVLHDTDFHQYFPDIMGEKLKTAPKGFDKEFADIDLLRPKSYAFGHSLTDEEVLSENLVEEAIDMFRQLSFMNRFLNDAIKHRK
ncbi:DUF2461 domain-containing protein [Mangrovibacterium marinum]|uniref:Uncharacterized protein (TIGR02453 family) n=1 Tax=Mangrovibacterium marinum TaxID=1639118 RepID=A0A2T5C6L1_9BACT|nr:DUF2461 domain-containing protein [Mangrovibacterium marinum]PTN10571.1 uncharacterized protein (TIGR02453 family) [Mangrovibacterium marinum]